MKKNLIALFALVSICGTAFCQTTSSVNFDNYTSLNDNDLKNKFTGDYTFSQVPNSGITGGAISITGNNTIGGHENNLFAIFKDTIAITSSTIKASICFKHSAATSDDYPSTILKIQTAGAPEWTMSDYIQAEVAIDELATQKFDLTIRGISASATNGLASNALIPGNWYRLSLTIQKNTSAGSADSLNCTALLENLGTSGTATAQTVSSKNQLFRYVEDFYNPDFSVVVGITGNKDGGMTHLDNFSVTGVLQNGTTSIPKLNVSEQIHFSTLVENTLRLHTDIINDFEYNIFNSLGQLQETGTLNQSKEINVSHYIKGVYYIHFFNKLGSGAKKFIKN